MLTEYEDLPEMYKASLDGLNLVIEPVTPHVYKRIGTAGLGHTKIEAVEKLRLRMMQDFTQKMDAVAWQARQFIHGVGND